MNTTIVDCPRLFQQVGALCSPRRPGPEAELVNWFLTELPLSAPRGCRVTVFREPKLSSGTPDFVVVYWRERPAEAWSVERSQVTPADIRVMQYMVQHGETTTEELKGFFTSGIDDCIDRLRAAGMVKRWANAWKPRALSHCFAVREIIAFEAKVNDWSSALDQAFLNTWFASQSYVLVPHIPRGEKLLGKATALGLGVWTQAEGCCLQPNSSSTDLPISYASWLFNEWAWRAEVHMTG